MAKYSIDGSTLTGIANAIREQYGEDTPIAVSDMEEAIREIEGGGGGESVPFDVTFGDITPTSTINMANGLTIDHQLGYVPNMFLLYSDVYDKATLYELVSFIVIRGEAFNGSRHILRAYGEVNAITASISVTDEAVSATSGNRTELIAGHTYRWIAIGNEKSSGGGDSKIIIEEYIPLEDTLYVPLQVDLDLSKYDKIIVDRISTDRDTPSSATGYFHHSIGYPNGPMLNKYRGVKLWSMNISTTWGSNFMYGGRNSNAENNPTIVDEDGEIHYYPYDVGATNVFFAANHTYRITYIPKIEEE